VGEEKVKTSVKWNHKEAVWDETFSLQISTEQLADENLMVEVYDKERIRRKRLLGTVAIKLHSLLSVNGGSWYALEGGEKSSCGEVHLNLTIK
jgi:Ca2+-dependent lipid-binding protein